MRCRTVEGHLHRSTELPRVDATRSVELHIIESAANVTQRLGEIDPLSEWYTLLNVAERCHVLFPAWSR
ncbi:MAG: hypothetical protein ACK559_38315, partial [bacterium]